MQTLARQIKCLIEMKNEWTSVAKLKYIIQIKVLLL